MYTHNHHIRLFVTYDRLQMCHPISDLVGISSFFVKNYFRIIIYINYQTFSIFFPSTYTVWFSLSCSSLFTVKILSCSHWSLILSPSTYEQITATLSHSLHSLQHSWLLLSAFAVMPMSKSFNSSPTFYIIIRVDMLSASSMILLYLH